MSLSIIVLFLSVLCYTLCKCLFLISFLFLLPYLAFPFLHSLQSLPRYPSTSFTFSSFLLLSLATRSFNVGYTILNCVFLPLMLVNKLINVSNSRQLIMKLVHTRIRLYDLHVQMYDLQILRHMLSHSFFCSSFVTSICLCFFVSSPIKTKMCIRDSVPTVHVNYAVNVLSNSEDDFWF